jgi:hypothetical protein
MALVPKKKAAQAAGILEELQQHDSSISTSGDSLLQSNGCGTTLASGASCKLSVVFHPTVAGTRKGGLFIGDDALGSPQTISLSGKGI